MINNIIIYPTKIKLLTTTNSKNRGKFLIKPLSPGFGITLGNSLRRVLISYLEGYAIYYIMINGVKHEFSYIDGVIENINEIILNLKQIRFKLKRKISHNIPEHFTIFLTKKKAKITAGDLCGSITFFEVLNPKLLILTKELDTNLNITLGIKKGIGYVPVEKNKYLKKKIGKIPIDTIFSPIRNVRFKVENCEFHNSFETESLIIEIRTDGSITPTNAFKKASSLLRQHFTFNYKKKDISDIDADYDTEDISATVIKTWAELVKVKTWAELVKVKKKGRNFFLQSLYELNKRIKTLALDLGYWMDLSKYQMKIYNKKKRIRKFREKMRKIVKLRNVLKRRKKIKNDQPK
ncbi:DNA-directed RNA polymerase subunit alpha [Candidatus Karelsulcia muelleri]